MPYHAKLIYVNVHTGKSSNKHEYVYVLHHLPSTTVGFSVGCAL